MASASSNVRWVLAAQIGRLVIQFVSIPIMSRLLSPADFGLMAIAIVVANFAMLFRDMGTSAALIQTKELNSELIDAVFSLNVFIGCVMAAAGILLAPIAAWAFSAETLKGLLMVLFLTFPIAAVSVAPLALLERNSNFRAVARIEISSSALGMVAGVLCASGGLGAYSLAIQSVVTAMLLTLQVWFFSNWVPRLCWAPRELRKIWSFSSNLMTFNLINYFARNVDAALVGRFFDAASLGWYSVANRLLLFPIQNLTHVVSRALLPVYSRRQDNVEHIRSMYVRTVSLIAAISAPMMFGLWALREPFVLALLGSKWHPVADILWWFAPMGFLQSIISTSGTLLASIGRTDVLRRLGIANTTVLVGAFVVGLQFGLMGIVQAYFVATCVLTVTTMQVVLTKIDCNPLFLIGRISMPVTCASVMAALLVLMNSYLQPYCSDILRLLIVTPIGLLLYSSLLIVFESEIVRELMVVLSGIRRQHWTR